MSRDASGSRGTEAAWQRAPFVTPRHSWLPPMPSPSSASTRRRSRRTPRSDVGCTSGAARPYRADRARERRPRGYPTDHSVDRGRRRSRPDRHGRLRPFAPARAPFGRRYARHASIHDRADADVALTVAPYERVQSVASAFAYPTIRDVVFREPAFKHRHVGTAGCGAVAPAQYRGIVISDWSRRLRSSSARLGSDTGWRDMADRADRRHVIATFQTIQMLCPALLVVLLLTNAVEPWMVVALSLVVGITDALSMPSSQTIVPSIVRRDEIAAALALNATQFNLSRILGPALAGMLMASVGAIGCFAVNAASYLPFIGVALWILPRRSAPPTTDESFDRRHLFSGLRHIAGASHVRDALLTVLATSTLCGPLIIFLPGAGERCPAWRCERVQPGYRRVRGRRLAGCGCAARRRRPT